MGAEIGINGGYVEANTAGFKGARIALEFPSVGATENIMMAASLADGTTVIGNAAREPEISDLGDILRSMGAGVEGDGTGTVTIVGRKSLSGCHHRLIPDRLEAGSWLLLSLLTGCNIPVRGARRSDLQALEAALFEAGVRLDEKAGALHATCPDRLRGTDVITQPHPGFPTDMQAQWMVLMCMAGGTSVIRETVFENRFQHVPELLRMGADITIRGNTAVVKGGSGLKGAPVMCSDLRAGIALVLAALAADGESEVRRIYHLDRGYERLVEKLAAVGADIRRIPQAG
jgi:UDP-N-acetylglucosamine 1-carboxyvinyltransferase